MLKKNIYFSVILDHFTPWTLQNFLSNGSQLVVDENMPGCTPELKHWLFYSILNRDFKVSGCTPNLGVKSECDTKTKNQSRHKTRKNMYANVYSPYSLFDAQSRRKDFVVRKTSSGRYCETSVGKPDFNRSTTLKAAQL